MGFKEIFIKPDKEVNNKQIQQPQAAPAPVVQVQPQTFINQSTPTTTSVEVDESGIRHLWEVLADRNLPGPDLLEVKNFAESLKGTGDPLEKRYLQAFLILRAQYPNFDKNTLLQSIETYRSFVMEEKNEGLKQFAEKKQEKIGNREAMITNLTAEISTISEQIKKLQEEAAEKESQINSIKDEINTATSEINQEEARFNATFEQFLGALDSDKNIMSNLNI